MDVNSLSPDPKSFNIEYLEFESRGPFRYVTPPLLISCQLSTLLKVFFSFLPLFMSIGREVNPLVSGDSSPLLSQLHYLCCTYRLVS